MTSLCLSSLLFLLLFWSCSGASFSGSAYFGDCREDTCQRGDHFKGYGCRRGNCRLVCQDNDCYHQGVRIRRPSPDESLRLSRFRFEGCSSSHCSSGHVDGYDCELGTCRYVCDGAVCHRGNRKTGKGTRQRSTMMMKSPSSASKGLRFLFEDCSDNICTKGDHHGYGCSSGVCDMVCEKDECYHGNRVYHFDLKGKVKKAMEFDDCRDLNCKNQRGFGYDCETGHCAIACDDHQCFRIAASSVGHRGKSPSRRLKEASRVFSGCGAERRCQTGSTFGYNCQAGVCEYVCTADACLHKGNPMFEGKEPMSIEDLYFDGCASAFCFKGDFDGFHCSRGHCAFACNDDRCFEAESYSRAFPKPTPPPEPEKSPEEQFDFGKELQQIQFSKFFNFGDTPFF